PLDVRQWTCENCHTKHDTDVNAAINLTDEGLRILTCGTRDKADRQTVSLSNRGRKKSTAMLVSGLLSALYASVSVGIVQVSTLYR
uniref:zinc ribbon domain-containing protein n=1 Tax=Okeania sp. SIO2F4 TaxID=2607790 RepID=UPI0025FC3F43